MNIKTFTLASLLLSGLAVHAQSSARLQVIHNAADLAAQTVDIYAGTTLLLDNFKFRSASPFVDVPAGVPIVVGVAPGNSTSSADAIASFNLTLTAGKKYIAVANGIVSTSGYTPAQPFNLYVYDMAREVASQTNKVDVLVFHGATDAPAVDIYESKIPAGTLVNDAMYGNFYGYLSLDPMDYKIQVRDASGVNVVATYDAPLATLLTSGQALTVVASGFLNPANNSGGPAFGLYVADANGGDLLALPTSSTGIAENSANLKGQFNVFPSPAINNKVTVDFDLLNQEEVNIEVKDIMGRLVKQISLGNCDKGKQQHQIQLTNVSSGTYALSIKTASGVSTRMIQVLQN